MVSRDVSLRNMDFKDDDFQRAAALYDDLNATACFYTTALPILSKANWSEQVNFDSHIGHQAMVAVAKGWTCAVGLPSDDFNHYHLALAMSTLPEEIHKDLKLTYEAIVAIIPPPFHELAGSKVLFTRRQCQWSSEQEVATFIVTSKLSEFAPSFEYFEAAFPWTEKLLQVTDVAKNTACQECASDFDWNLRTVAPCRLVWLQYVREQQPLATSYTQFLDKDPFQSGGRIWQCIALVIHQGHDPLNGEHQPCEHFYLLECEGSNPKLLSYNNSVGLHYSEISHIKGGDRIGGLLYRISTITSTWSNKVTCSVRGSHLGLRRKFSKNKGEQEGLPTRKTVRHTKRTVNPCPRTQIVKPPPCSPRELQSSYIPERLCPLP